MPESSFKEANLYDRIIQRDVDRTLFHYCSSETFLAILQGGKIRFSDANMMNDGSEGRYGYGIFEKAADKLLKMVPDQPAFEGLTVDFFDEFDARLSPKQFHSHPIIACFSTSPDVLSQWRAYGQDGQGWSIGFSSKSINAMPITLLEVLYDPKQQVAEVMNYLAVRYLHFKEVGGSFKDAVGQDAALLGSFLHAYKDPSFAEEKEVRALHELSVKWSDDGAILQDEGGTAGGQEVRGEPVKFRADGSSITAYVDIPFQKVDDVAISDVWYGPCNRNGVGNAVYPLTQAGYRNVSLHRSASFYRGR
jgi:hypothetical protein